MADLPSWKPLDAVAPPSSDGAGRIVALVASEDAAHSGWGANAALDLARAWTEEGRRVMVVDGVLDAPSLHEAAGVANREGLVDAALHGASVSHVSHAVEDGGFFLVTAGTPVADPVSVARSGRWHRLAEGVTEAGVLLLLYLRDGRPATGAFLGSASDIVVLAAPGEPLPSSIGELATLVRAVTGPSDPAAVPAPDSAKKVRAGQAAAPKVFQEDKAGSGRLVLLLLAAIVVAAGLGYLLTSLL